MPIELVPELYDLNTVICKTLEVYNAGTGHLCIFGGPRHVS
jgi:hypothetical protein